MPRRTLPPFLEFALLGGSRPAAFFLRSGRRVAEVIWLVSPGSPLLLSPLVTAFAVLLGVGNVPVAASLLVFAIRLPAWPRPGALILGPICRLLPLGGLV